MAAPSRAVFAAVVAMLLLPARGLCQFPADTQLDSLLQRRVDEARAVGIVLGLLHADGTTRVLFAGSAGQDARPLGPRTLFEIGSITKVFTGTLLSDVARRGEVSLSDPLAQHLPDGVRVPSRAGKEITLIDLATHRSSLPRLPTNLAPADVANPYADYTVEQMYDFLSGHELEREIGSAFEYSNLGVGLLGHALTRAAGASSYEALVRRRILDPLRMGETGIELDDDMRAWMAQGHDERGRPVPLWDIPALAGAGALRSNVVDMLRFLDANVGEPTSALEQSMRAAQAPQPGASLDDATQISVGLNWMVRTVGDTATAIVWHNGGTAGFRTFIGFDPRREIGVVVLANSNHSVDDIGFHLLVPGLPLAAPRDSSITPVQLAILALSMLVLMLAAWKWSHRSA